MVFNFSDLLNFSIVFLSHIDKQFFSEYSSFKGMYVLIEFLHVFLMDQNCIFNRLYKVGGRIK